MNTEPPEGDELQRMLVSMKRTVLERATPRPRRRRGRSGIVIGVVALLAVGTATGAVALTLSQQDRPVAAPVHTQEPEPAPSATTPSSAPITATPTPTARPWNTVARIPTTCRGLVPASEYGRLFGGVPSKVMDTDPQQEGPALSCEWRESEITDSVIYVTAATTTVQEVRHLVDTFGDEPQIGNACTERPDGTLCQFRVPLDVGEKGYTLFARGTSYVIIDQIDFPTNGLLDAVVGEIWGD